MDADHMDNARFRRVASVERKLARGRRFVQALDADTPTQLSGSAPMIWDLLAEHETVEQITAMLQQRFSDSPDVISGGVRTALASLWESALVVEVGTS